MSEKISMPESLPPESTPPELMSELEEKINTISDDIKRINEGTKKALKELKDKKEREQQGPDNQIKEKRE